MVAWEKPCPPPRPAECPWQRAQPARRGSHASLPGDTELAQKAFFQAFLLLWEAQSCSTSGAGGLPGPPRGSPAPGCRWPHPRRAPAPRAAPGLCLFPLQVTFVPVHPEAEWFLADKPTVPTEKDSPGKLWYVPALLLVRVSSWAQGCLHAAGSKGRVKACWHRGKPQVLGHKPKNPAGEGVKGGQDPHGMPGWTFP